VSESDTPALPLFYRNPQPLDAALHADLRLVDGDYAFAAEVNAAPLAAVEFASAMRHYPIVFSETGGFPLAVLGLGQANRFVTGGHWAEQHHVPAYVRRYPFVFVEASDDRFALAVDLASERLVQGGEEGQPLFADGKPTVLTQAALVFCRDFHAAHGETRSFVDALAERELLIAQQADAKLPGGEARRLAGFRVIDREKLAALPDDVVADWHRKGWLALAALHLASLDRFVGLLELENQHAQPVAA
jgi:hypothetical protein